MKDTCVDLILDAIHFLQGKRDRRETESVAYVCASVKGVKGIPGNQERETISEERLEPGPLRVRKSNQRGSTVSDAVKKSRRWGRKAPDHPLDVEMRNSPVVVKKHVPGK